MKKTAFVAIMVVALVFGLVAYATGLTETVVVTAKINPAFSFTIDNGNSFTFGTVDVGTNPSIVGPQMVVKSNRPWTYTEDSVTYSEPELADVASQSHAPVALGNRGVTHIDYTYALDLTTDEAYDIPSDLVNDMTIEYVYSAVQN